MFGRKKNAYQPTSEVESANVMLPSRSDELVMSQALSDKQREIDGLRWEVSGLHRAIFELRKSAPVGHMSEEAQRGYSEASHDLIMGAAPYLRGYGYELHDLPPLGWGSTDIPMSR